MEIVKLKITDLEANIGQMPDLPMNPREWTQSDIDSLARSLKETPELFEARPIIVYPFNGKYVILGGNLRYEASRQNKAAEVPCVVMPAETPIDKLKEIIIKDNGSWGKWSMDALANEWDDLPLGDWGIPVWNPEKAKADAGVGGSLPAELNGVDLTPDDLPKIQGEDTTAMERIIICYRKDQEEALAGLLGLESIDKVVYNFDEFEGE